MVSAKLKRMERHSERALLEFELNFLNRAERGAKPAAEHHPEIPGTRWRGLLTKITSAGRCSNWFRPEGTEHNGRGDGIRVLSGPYDLADALEGSQRGVCKNSSVVPERSPAPFTLRVCTTCVE